MFFVRSESKHTRFDVCPRPREPIFEVYRMARGNRSHPGQGRLPLRPEPIRSPTSSPAYQARDKTLWPRSMPHAKATIMSLRESELGSTEKTNVWIVTL